MGYVEEYKNLNILFQDRAEKSAKKGAIKYRSNNTWEEISWENFYKLSKNVGMGLKELGFEKRDKGAILSNSRAEWFIVDMGIVGISGVTVPIYQSNTPKECLYIINNSGSKFIFVEDLKQLDKILEIKDKIEGVKKVILLTGELKEENPLVITIEQLYKIGEKYSIDQFKSEGSEISDKELATIVYTSGTTGEPKGVMLSHRALLANSQALNGVISQVINEGDWTIVILPLAHIFAKINFILSIYKGVGSGFPRGIDTIVDDMAVIKPALMGAVPRIYEKVYDKVIGQVEDIGGVTKKLFYWSIKIGSKVSKYKQKRKMLPPTLMVKYKLAKKLVFSKLADKFGGNLKFSVSAGAPLSQKIAEFLHAADILILESYGITEAAGAVTLNHPKHYQFGTVGMKLDTVDIKLDNDGEILIKGDILMDGYYKKEIETKEVIDSDGWFHTGDIGEIDKKGFYKITDRKKDIIITAAGKNIPPQYIENLLKTDKNIEQVIVLGDRKKYLVALINLNYEEIEKYAKSNGIKYNKKEDLSKHLRIIKYIENIVDEKNSNLPSYATIKKFKIISDPFSVENGELTPTLKVKRSFCMKKYEEIINSMYL